MRGAGALGGCVFTVAGDRDGAVGGHQAAFGGLAALVGVELPADRARGVRAEEATELGLVLEGLADRARGRVLGGCDRRRGLADHDRLIGAAALGFLVVGVAGVGGHPVVPVGVARAGAPGGCVFDVAGDRDGAVVGPQAAFVGLAALAGVELPLSLHDALPI